MKPLVVIPTYNEKENIQAICTAVLSLSEKFNILVVDDSSPDGTGDLVLKMKEQSDRVHLLVREKKEGLGRAYLAGFDWGLKNGFDVLIEMDADFSHRPQDLSQIYQALIQSGVSRDFVVGSRWVSGGGTVNWGLGRKIISKGGSFYSSLILGYPIQDWTGGFNAWTKQTLEKINLSLVKSNGYSFQIELKYRALRAGCKSFEQPIIFEDRRVGKSKMSMKIVLEALWRVWLMRIKF